MSSMCSFLYARNVAFRHVEKFCDVPSFHSARKQGSNCNNVIVSQLGLCVSLSNQVLTSFNCVSRILSFGSRNKVTRVNAFRVVA